MSGRVRKFELGDVVIRTIPNLPSKYKPLRGVIIEVAPTLYKVKYDNVTDITETYWTHPDLIELDPEWVFYKSILDM